MSDVIDYRFELVKTMSAAATPDLFDPEAPLKDGEIAKKVVPEAEKILQAMGLGSYKFEPVDQDDIERIYNRYDSEWRVKRSVRVNPFYFYKMDSQVNYLGDMFFKNITGFKYTKVIYSVCGFSNDFRNGDSLILSVSVWFEAEK